MNNWPVFDTKYPSEMVESLPGYWEMTVVAFIVLVACSIVLFFVMSWRGRSHALLLVSTRPHSLRQPKEYLPPRIFFPLSLLHTSAMVGITVTLLVHSGTDIALESFWRETARYSIIFALFIVLSTVIYDWLSRTFGSEEQRSIWIPNHFLLIFLFGLSLFIPMAGLLFSLLSSKDALILMISLFALFRIWSTHRLLAIFNQLLRYPLHIILYLCACEIGPWLFMLNSSVFK